MLLEFSVPMRKSIFLYLLSPRCYYFLLFIFHCSLYRFVVMSSVVYFIFTFTLSRNHYVFATHSISLPPHSLARSLSHNPYISLTTQQTFLWLLVSRTKLEVSSFHILIFFLVFFLFIFTPSEQNRTLCYGLCTYNYRMYIVLMLSIIQIKITMIVISIHDYYSLDRNGRK